MSVRTFTSTDGQAWTAQVQEVPQRDGTAQSRSVLRFTSGAETVDVPDYPPHWYMLGADVLVDLLYLGRPPVF